MTSYEVGMGYTWSNAWLPSGTTLQEVVNQPFLSSACTNGLSNGIGRASKNKMFSLPSLE